MKNDKLSGPLILFFLVALSPNILGWQTPNTDKPFQKHTVSTASALTAGSSLTAHNTIANSSGSSPKSTSSASKSTSGKGGITTTDDKVTICHYGNTLEVASSAVPDHQAHGDLVCSCTSIIAMYPDADSDGFGAGDSLVQQCIGARGFSENSSDCDDDDSSINPDAEEVCNGIDDNCDGLVDDGSNGGHTYNLDSDLDGFGSSSSGVITTCASTAPSGYTEDNSDCDDLNAEVNPRAQEVCNGIDDNCDGLTDDATSAGQNVFNLDADLDGFGSSSSGTITTCAASAPIGFTSDDSDCDDTNALVHPGATEVCNEIDDDCDGVIDVGATYGRNTYFRDADGDGFGSSASGTTTACGTTAPAGFAANDTDCDDSRSEVHPGAQEVCNGLDDNCDTLTDDEDPTVIGQVSWLIDADGDGYGASGSSTGRSCAQSAPAGFAASGGDCNDADPAVHPGAPELCNGIDDDCDGQLETMTGLAAGLYHSLALCSTGAVLAWGNNDLGQLGTGQPGVNQLKAVELSGLPHIVAVAAGFFHSLALAQDGTVYAWGINADGELGDGTMDYYHDIPTLIPGLSGVVAISAGGFDSLAVMGDGTVQNWGYNGMGELGDGSADYTRNVPATVPGVEGVIAAELGDDHTLVLLDDGTVRAWGYNADGELGNGSSDFFSNVPVTVSGLSGVIEVQAGATHSLALLDDGTVQAWGYNGDGELGDGSAAWSRNVPGPVPGLSGVIELATGAYHSLASLSDGTVVGWGYDYDGELGDGAPSWSQPVPVPIDALRGAVAISGGYLHTAAALPDGTLVSSGWNYYGQLGDGTTVDRTKPVRVLRQ